MKTKNKADTRYGNPYAKYLLRKKMREMLAITAILVSGFVQAQEVISYSGQSYNTGYGNTSPNYYSGTATVSRSRSISDETTALVNQMKAESDRRTAEAYRQLDASRAQRQLEYQTEELKKQTKILADMSSSESSGGSSSAYMPSPTVVLPQIYTPPTSQNSQLSDIDKNKARRDDDMIRRAQGAKSFSSTTNRPRERQLSKREGAEYENLMLPENEDFIKSLLQAYSGNFTDYQWIVDSVDEQTSIVTCKVSLDGEPHDFKFKVNGEVGSCHYIGGTALAKLAHPVSIKNGELSDEDVFGSSKSRVIFLDE